MLKQEIKDRLFEDMIAIEFIFDCGFFDYFKKMTYLFNNYEFQINFKIKEHNNDIDLPIDFIKGVEKFTLKIPQPNQNLFESTIAKICKEGLLLFPGEFYEKGEGQSIVAEFNKIVKNRVDYLHNIIFKRHKFGLNNFMKALDFLKNQPIREKQNIKSKISNYIELYPDSFYILNEILTRFIKGGYWENYIYNDLELEGNLGLGLWEDDTTNIFPFFWILLDNYKYIDIYLDAVLNFDNKQITERLLNLCSIPWEDMINYELRDFHNGIYCPLDKSEYISSLTYSPDVKETLYKLDKYIETLPFFEQKRVTVNCLINHFKEKGLTEYVDPFIKIFKEYASNFKEHASNFEEHKKRNEMALEKLIRKSFKIDDLEFVSKLQEEHRIRYNKIFEDMLYISIPIYTDSKDKKAMYKHMISELGLLVSNILAKVFDDDINISNLRVKVKTKKSIIEITKDDKESLIEYSKCWGNIYNNIRHKDEKTHVDYEKTMEFIKDSYSVLEIALSDNIT